MLGQSSLDLYNIFREICIYSSPQPTAAAAQRCANNFFFRLLFETSLNTREARGASVISAADRVGAVL